MSTEYTKSQEGDWFYLYATASGYDPCDDSLGRGSSQSTARFRSEEAREIFIQARQYESAAQRIACELKHLQTELRAVLTPVGRIRRKALLGIIAGLPK